MKTLIVVAMCFLSGCSMTPRQRWAVVGGIVVTGIVISARDGKDNQVNPPERGINPPNCAVLSCQ